MTIIQTLNISCYKPNTTTLQNFKPEEKWQKVSVIPPQDY